MKYNVQLNTTVEAPSAEAFKTLGELLSDRPGIVDKSVTVHFLEDEGIDLLGMFTTAATEVGAAFTVTYPDSVSATATAVDDDADSAESGTATSA